MAVMLITASNVFAQAHFETIDGLRFLIDENAKAATLVANPDEKYSGDFIVPEKITSKDEKEYVVTALGEKCFSGCSSLTSITIPSSVTSLGNECFSSCSSLTSITIPSSVTSLGNGCFYHCDNLTSITIPSSVTSLGKYCFNYCYSLTSITIPSSITSLGDECFSDCFSLTSITIPSSITSLGDECFNCCYRLTNITIPSSVTSLGDECFYNCSRLTNITIPSSVTSLGNSCFKRCSSLTSITIPSSVTSLGNNCFGNCSSLTSITIPSSVTSLGNNCFDNCSSLSNITIPSSVTSLGDNCFSGCSILTSITIPSSVTSLGDKCFSSCSILTSITIPSSVTSLGDKCFSSCSKLESTYFNGKLPKNTLYSSIPTTCIFYVPQEYLLDYKDALGSKYTYIYARNDGGDSGDKPIQKCSTPTITYADGSLHFFSSTTGAEYHYVIEAPDATNGNYSKDGEVALSAAYKLSAYATADGYQPSDKATATLYWLNANLENDPSTNINQAKTRGIVATSDGGIVTLSGLNNGEVVKFFSPDGRLMGVSKAENGKASYAISRELIIAKIGNQTIKILNK